jgi:cryptochrome
MSISASPRTSALHWFRKGLRLHDNPALIEACNHCKAHKGLLYPVFCIDPWFAKPEVVGVNRYNFLLESLTDLDSQLRSMGSRLYVVKGKPEEQLPLLIEKWGVNLVTFERDSEPYALKRDAEIRSNLKSLGKTNDSL